jgi:hypothetical protein
MLHLKSGNNVCLLGEILKAEDQLLSRARRALHCSGTGKRLNIPQPIE